VTPAPLAGFWLKENALDGALCGDLCRAIDSSDSVENIGASYQRCSKYTLPATGFVDTLAALRSLWAEYLAVAPHMGTLSRATHIETPFVLRYESDTGDHFSMHADVWNAESALRQVSALVYLNDADGWDTIFPNQQLKFAPKTGRAIFYPSFWTHPHEALPPRSGRKYILVSWFCFAPGGAPYGTVPL
jgi:hypothetical protein